MKKLENFLLKNGACKSGFEFAKDLTLEQFLNTCERGDWMLWLFGRANLKSLKEITLAKGRCANTVRHLMRDKRSLVAVDTAIAFGEGRATKAELDAAADDARAAAAAAAANAADAADAARAADARAAAAAAAWAAADVNADAADAADAARAAYAAAAAWAAAKNNQKQTADICRKYLPLPIWDQSKL